MATKDRQRLFDFWSESGKPYRVGTPAHGVELKLVKLPSACVFRVPLLPFPCYYLWEDQWSSLSWSPWHCLKTAQLPVTGGRGAGVGSWYFQTGPSFSPAAANLPSLTHPRRCPSFFLSVSGVCPDFIKLQKPMAIWIVCSFKTTLLKGGQDSLKFILLFNRPPPSPRKSIKEYMGFL